MINIISPTGLNPRGTDAFGSGAFRSPRGGSRLHAGVDYICIIGQDVYAPISGKITRLSHPYADDLKYQGIVMNNRYIEIQMFYLVPNRNLIRNYVQQGQVIGRAQDISKRYNTETRKMVPHIHLQVNWINPEALRQERPFVRGNTEVVDVDTMD
jgi:murein DD-endopeptidase MepM/ murein hydrolase activator NlpD